jgi:hypothetical protein
LGPKRQARIERKSRLNRGARLIQTTELCQGGSFLLGGVAALILHLAAVEAHGRIVAE